MAKFILIESDHIGADDADDLILNTEYIIGARKSINHEINLTIMGSNANYRLTFVDDNCRDVYWDLLMEVCNPLEVSEVTRGN